MREAQPARDARDELVLVERRDARRPPRDPRLSCAALTNRHRLEGSRQRQPARARACPSGSKAALTRAISAAFGSATPKPSRSGRAGLAEQPAAGSRRGVTRAARAPLRSSAATCTVPTPTSAQPAHAADAVERTRRASRPRAGRHRDAAAVRALRAAAARRTASSPAAARLGLDVVRRCPRAARDVVLPSHEDRRRAGTPRAHRAGDRRRSPHQRGTPAAGWQRRVTCVMHAERAERADEQPGEVVAGDVLHRRPAAPHEPAVGGDEAHLEHLVAQRAVRGAAGCPESPTASDPPTVAFGVARVERALLARARRAPPSSSATVVPAPTRDGEVGGLVRRRSPPAPGPRRRREAAGRRPPGASRPPTGSTASRRPRDARSATVALGARLRSTCPPGRAASSPHRLPRGQDLVGVRATRRVERVAQPGLRVEVVGREHQRHGVALLEPDAVLAREHAAGVDARAQDLVAGVVHALPDPRLARVEHDQRVQVAVAGVEHVHHREPLLGARSSYDLAQHVDEPGARDDRVVQVVVGRDAGDRAERRLAALPEQRALGVVGRDAHRCARRARARSRRRRRPASADAGLEPVELDEQHGGGVARVARRRRSPRPRA